MDYLDQVALTRHAREAFENWRRAAAAAWFCSPPPADTQPISTTPIGGDQSCMFGRESAGVPERPSRPPTRGCVIPMRPGLRSINVAMAGRHGSWARRCGRRTRFPPRNGLPQVRSHEPSPYHSPRTRHGRRTIEARKARARAWFERAARRHLRGVRGGRGRAAGGRAARRRAPAASCARPGSAPINGEPGGGGVMAMMRGPRVREGRRARLDRPRRVRAGIPQGDPRRRRRPALLGLRHLADRPSAEPARAGGAHEHALRRHDAKPGSAAAPT